MQVYKIRVQQLKLVCHSTCTSVSYTHLDVYKRQVYVCVFEKINFSVDVSERTINGFW